MNFTNSSNRKRSLSGDNTAAEVKINDINGEDLHKLVTNTTEPVVLKRLLQWEIMKWDLQKWQEVFGSETLEFRCGKNSCTKLPQWDIATKVIRGTFEDILKYSSEDSKEWVYFDYKYLNQHLLNLKQFRDAITWNNLGFSNISADDCTLWIGSKRAHTALHVDTYGCNIVAQVYGRKLWVLFPPKTDLKETRVPYEESSIYSKYNIFSPNVSSVGDSKSCRKVILNPGEILVVPSRWWHYVENLEPAISVNAWIPLPQDDEQRLQEAITETLIKKMAANFPEDIKNSIINPNMRENMESNSFDVVNTCREICLSKRGITKVDYVDMNAKVRTIINTCDDIEVVPTLTEKEFKEFIESQVSRFTAQDQDVNEPHSDIISIIDAVTHSDVISLIKEKLLNK